ncbi:hypothetical protein SCNU_17827 [Gordonia neofelifaecis NRRL B-59395]|uniref:Uncharacterized protein n=1 Tax=Gordonia neofelifaecis NRRL B-59395 TaxID=644548 RepID=F1YNR9_9ACTN|nr:hypothetical protein SCNU_17827 [Gordonia neofelifaecis NRRL B-59395]
MTFVFAGQRYPISAETGDRIVEFVTTAVEDGVGCYPHVVPTTDGRQVIANLGPSMPYAIEVGIAADQDSGARSPEEDRVRSLADDLETVSDREIRLALELFREREF